MPNVGLVYGKLLKVDKNNFFGKKQLITPGNLPEGYVTKDLLKYYRVGLLTIMLRKKFLNKNNVFKTQYNYLGDLNLQQCKKLLEFTDNMKIKCKKNITKQNLFNSLNGIKN